MSIPFVLERGSCQGQYECLNCYTAFYDEHGNPIHGWSWCPVCGIKWEGALLFRHKKWRRFYDEHGIKEGKVPIRGWVLEKRWHGFDGNVDAWEEESRSWEPSGRKEIMSRYHAETKDQLWASRDGDLFWEYRLVRKTTHVWWSKHWAQIINGK